MLKGVVFPRKLEVLAILKGGGGGTKQVSTLKKGVGVRKS